MSRAAHNNAMHAKSGLRVFLKWKIFRPDSVIADVIRLMQFSTRTLMALVLGASICLGSRSIYLNCWESHCRRLAPSMYRHLINVQKVEGEVQSFGLGSLTEPPRWKIPSEELIEQIDIDGLQSVSSSDETDAVCFVKIIAWSDWNTAIVNFGTSHNLHEAEGSDCVEMKYVDGAWKMPEPSFRKRWEQGVSVDSIEQVFSDTAKEFPGQQKHP